MAPTSRERVTRCLNYAHPDRMPRELWLLPWSESRFPREIETIRRRYPGDYDDAPNVLRPSRRVSGNIYEVGVYTDEWGCRMTNIQAGLEGQIRDPILQDIREWRTVRPPYEMLPSDPRNARDVVNRHCAGTDGYVRTCDSNFGSSVPTPWERLQYLRGAENAMMDLMDRDEDLRRLLKLIHDFFLASLEFWVSTDIDAIRLGDDWGSQTQLLIPPAVWRELFKPLYSEYCDLAHSHGKAVFMHSDGNIAEIYDDLIEIGVDALNSQLFCMDLQDLGRRAKGRITFWGEIDRQHVLTATDPQAGRDAVRQVARSLYDPAGGIIAQLSFGLAANPEVVEAVFSEWELVEHESRLRKAD